MNNIKTGQCLMIRTKDQRKFFTHEENYIQLLEFSKIFQAEVSVVEVKEAVVLDLAQLAPAICDTTFVQPAPEQYQILEVKIGQKKRQDILHHADKIRRHIIKRFLRGKLVSLKDLRKKFSKLKVTTACLCNHLTKAREELAKQGHQIEKVGGGKYQLFTQRN